MKWKGNQKKKELNEMKTLESRHRMFSKEQARIKDFKHLINYFKATKQVNSPLLSAVYRFLCLSFFSLHLIHISSHERTGNPRQGTAR